MAENPNRSLRITIPALKAKASPPPASEETMEDQSSKRKRKVPSRYLDAGGYEDDDAVAAAEPEKKLARTSTAGRSRRQSTASEPAASVLSASNLFDEEDVEDARAAASTRGESEHDDALSDRSERHSSPVRTKTKIPKAAKGKASAGAASAKKGRANKRAVVMSDSDEEETYMDTSADVLAEETEDEEYMSEEEEKPAKKGKGKAKAAPKRTNSEKAPPPKKKAAEVSEAAKGKSKTAKKPLPSSASKHDEPIIDVVGGSSPAEPSAVISKSAPSALKLDSATPAAAPTLAPKKKLPTINKVKGPATSGSGLSTPTTPTTVPTKKTSNADTRDLDLNDSSIYQQLFNKKGPGGASVARPDMEERRKELNRMREEAKAKRKAESTHSFDLQAQAEKIARFEETLRHTYGNSNALYPNVMAGRWKQSYEENKRLQREQEQWAMDTAMKEEGEVV
ncbi:hypothetical protein D9619_005759 [Psilocybe cf. subviscida]|uniref:Uncharacterized protein n=1 Tax=Psilocybe cf. subviscida TaxID=2480587 RepID=A0A8H5FBF6_9AGAR|nr:hypothetical protein D9619_005759 [Psilocybe cf. subviscida]